MAERVLMRNFDRPSSHTLAVYREHGGYAGWDKARQMEDEGLSFLEFVEKNGLAHEEGSLFTYLARLMKAARMIWEVTTLDEWKNLEDKIRQKLAAVDDRVIESLWA